MSLVLVASALVLFALAGCQSEESIDTGYGDMTQCMTVAECQCGEKEGDPCTGGKCMSTMSGLSCAKECIAVGDPCDTGTCYFFGPNPGDFYCGPTGSSYGNSACGASTECMAGMQCLDVGGGTMNCFQVCINDTQCDPAVCTDTKLGFKVCVAEGP